MNYVGDNTPETVIGTAGTDTIKTFGGDDVVSGGGDRDHIETGDGADQAWGGEGDDWIDGGAGADLLLGEAGDDTLRGLGGDNTIDAGDGDDMVSGSGSSIVHGGAGSDGVGGSGLLFGDGGDDNIFATGLHTTARGGAGDDVISADVGDVDPLVGGASSKMFLDGGPGFDRFALSADNGAPQRIDMRPMATGGIVTFASGAVIRGFEAGVINEFSGHINLGDLDVDVFGRGADDLFRGGEGRSYLFGADGADRLFGGGGDDTVDGGAGADTLDGGGGRDILASGYGATVDLAAGTHQDAGGELDRIARFEDVWGSVAADRIKGDRHANLLQDNIGDPIYDAADTLSGGGGADTLVAIAGAESDLLAGGAGNDTFAFLYDFAEVQADLILDLEDGDVIDLSRIDANEAREGDQHFHLSDQLGGRAGAATLVWDKPAQRTLLLLDTNGDTEADITIAIAGKHADFAGFVL